MYIQDDPEYPQDRYTVIEAEVSGSPKTLWCGNWNGIAALVRLHEPCSNLR